jgi:cytochrome c-type biogenesis protein CcmE
MRRDKRFFIGLIGVGAVVVYLVVTGIGATMQWSLTPVELFARVAENPDEVGQRSHRVSGTIVPGSHSTSTSELRHLFVVQDPEDASITLTVEFDQPLPDTFSDSGEMEMEAVMEGVYRADGIFEATAVLTKCGSRYEAIPTEEVAVAERGVDG